MNNTLLIGLSHQLALERAMVVAAQAFLGSSEDPEGDGGGDEEGRELREHHRERLADLLSRLDELAG